jgi:hypothetical protein
VEAKAGQGDTTAPGNKEAMPKKLIRIVFFAYTTTNN